MIADAEATDEKSQPLSVSPEASPKRARVQGPPAEDREEVHIAVVGDTHFTPRLEDDTKLMADRLLDVVRKLVSLGLDELILLGDIIDRFNMLAVKEAELWIYELSKLIPVKVLMGNHDLMSHVDYLTGKHPFAAMGKLPNVTVVSRPIFDTIKGKRILYVPYVPDGRLYDAIKTVDPDLEGLSGCHLVCSHQTIYNSVYNGMSVTHGDKWDLDYPMLMNGHIHQMGVIQDNALNTGSPYQIHHNEPENNAIFIVRLRGVTCSDKPSQIQDSLNLDLQRPGPLATHWSCRLLEYQALSLNIPVKRTMRLRFEAYQKWEYTEDPKIYQLRVVIVGSKSQVESIRAGTKFRSLLKLAPRLKVQLDVQSVSTDPVNMATQATTGGGAVDFIQLLKTGTTPELSALIDRVLITPA
jgi:predicted phosphodiesterase